MKLRERTVDLAAWVLASLPAMWLLTHPVPLAWLVLFARKPGAPGYVESHTWPVILWCLVPSLLSLRDWRWRKPVSFGWIAVLFCSWQSYCYNTAAHPAGSPFVIWGLLPNSDSQTYLNNAVEIAEGVGMRLTFGARQMWPGFLATLHTLCQGDLKLMLSLLTLMQTTTVCLTWEMIHRLLGRAAAFVWLCCVAFFSRNYVIGLFMTEQLGLILGMLAAVMLLYGWKRRLFIPWLFGLFLLTLSLNTRPGCYFVLLCLLIGTFARFRSDSDSLKTQNNNFRTLAWRKGFISVCLVATCFLINSASYSHLVNPPRAPSNYWFILYGIAKGGTWAQAVHDFQAEPTLDRIPATNDEKGDREFFDKVKNAAIKEITGRPVMLLYGALRSWRYVVTKQTFFYRWGYGWWEYGLQLISAITLMLCCLRREIRGDGAFYLLIWIGIALSLPFVPPWDSGDRSYAATDPLVWLTPAFFFSLCAERLAARKSNKFKLARSKPVQHEEINKIFRGNATAGILIAAASILVPSILLEVNRYKTMPRYTDLLQLETESSSTAEISSTLIRPNRGIVVGARNTRTFVPYVSRDDFERGAPGGRQYPIGEFMKELPTGSYLALLERPRYFCCDLSTLSDAQSGSKIPMEDADWMSYKYIITLAKGMALTETQVMILCPSTASHAVFWQPLRQSL